VAALVGDSGHYRAGGIGVVKGRQVIMALRPLTRSISDARSYLLIEVNGCAFLMTPVTAIKH